MEIVRKLGKSNIVILILIHCDLKTFFCNHSYKNENNQVNVQVRF